MYKPDELITILNRILDGSRDEKDITLLRQHLEAINGSNQMQLAKNIVNANEINRLHIGDIINNQGLDKETKLILQNFLETLQQIKIQTSPQRQDDKYVAKNNSETQLILPVPPPILKNFDFEVVTVDAQGKETKRFSKQAEYFIENLRDCVVLEMVSITGGKFKMGAAKDEEASQEEERPQRIVNIKPFFLGKYPITQAQWKIVANLPKIKRHLEFEPSCFKGDNLPVERVSWYDVQEFCQRLSRETGRTYRLPSEAEWEYACRAKTSTPFHFGKIITTDLANFQAENQNINGVYRQQTSEVGNFPANDFGLFDMHGNVWEWCADYDHDDYYGAPSDGSAWLNDENEEYRILRGGSWDCSLNLCRSASRFSENASVADKEFGFRVVCS
ncbi:MAG: formylglycine-generating enzyme family protein [Cyanomargarita calcarea GSE-NOS-MK-12-04C]|jgi:formylglycine-generating enzyme required for sulfatase activity|uniref:Formylglycine-generating enzyme family protein n=1 Tax=Cyanomargarita calcarea GSE-NOS-MK-12-04C TaxID=2839659 RepID=A0A951UQZ6_9CYAN|nr:formylglycine-generating enzyme family protein [Cyanomargarita calcarea GSE-NOS-MK-12-04C]